MDAKEFLSSAYRMEQQVQSNLEQIERLRSLATKVTARLDREPVAQGVNCSGMENTIIRILEAEDELNRRIDELVERKLEVSRVIDRVADVTLRLILEKRYLLFYQWEEIALDLGVTVRWALVKHQEAVSAVQEILILDGIARIGEE